MKTNFDVVIVGGGVIGSAVARELSRYKLSICVLEKELDVCNGTSGRNTGLLGCRRKACAKCGCFSRKTDGRLIKSGVCRYIKGEGSFYLNCRRLISFFQDGLHFLCDLINELAGCLSDYIQGAL